MPRVLIFSPEQGYGSGFCDPDPTIVKKPSRILIQTNRQTDKQTNRQTDKFPNFFFQVRSQCNCYINLLVNLH